MKIVKDFWRPMIVEAPIDAILDAGSLDGFALHGLPQSGSLAYTADPFGLWRDDHLHVFVEQFDYRDARGTIGVHIVDRQFRTVETRTVLREPFHLSYPFIVEHDGETWMIPECCESGHLRIYRAQNFPFDWSLAATIDMPAIDATPFRIGDRWWMFYAPVGTARERLTHLNLASAPDLLGPWTPHRGNPVWRYESGARPAGPVLSYRDGLVLPVQDCTRSYGSGLRLLKIDAIEDQVRLTHGGFMAAPVAARPFVDGCHTLSPAGHVTLIDVKQRRFSFSGLVSRPLRELRRLRSARAAKTMAGDGSE